MCRIDGTNFGIGIRRKELLRGVEAAETVCLKQCRLAMLRGDKITECMLKSIAFERSDRE